MFSSRPAYAFSCLVCLALFKYSLNVVRPSWSVEEVPQTLRTQSSSSGSVLVICWYITNCPKTWCLKTVTILLFLTIQWVRNSGRSQLASELCSVHWGWKIHEDVFTHVSRASAQRAPSGQGMTRTAQLWLHFWGLSSQCLVMKSQGLSLSAWPLRAVTPTG